MLKLLLGLLPRAGEAAVGLLRFRNEFLLFSEPDLVILMMMTTMTMMLLPMMMATMIIVSSS